MRARHAIPTALLLLAMSSTLASQLIFEPFDRIPIVPENCCSGEALASATGDVDNDGDVDLVVAARVDYVPSTFTFDVLRNNGDGTFATPLPEQQILVFAELVDLRLGDINGDGVLDLASAEGDALRLRLGAGDGTFGAAATVFQSGDDTLFHLDLADLTGDGHLDLLALNGAHFGINPNDTERIDLIPGNGDGSFGVPSLVALMPNNRVPVETHARDLNGDGHTDLVVTGQNSFSTVALVLLGLPGGGFTSGGPPYAFTINLTGELDVADVTGDGQADLVLTSRAGFGIRPGDGQGNFGPVTQLDLSDQGAHCDVVVADFDSDGRADVAAYSSTKHEITFWSGQPDGSLKPGWKSLTYDDAERPFHVLDVDVDGRLDLVGTRNLSFSDVNWPTIHRNLAYSAGSPFADLGLSLGGAVNFSVADDVFTAPVLSATGSLLAGDPFTLTLWRNHASAEVAFLVLGLSPISAAFKGGVFVPAPDRLIGPFDFGAPFPNVHSFSTTWIVPAGIPAGLELWIQGWSVPTEPGDTYAATTAVLATMP